MLTHRQRPFGMRLGAGLACVKRSWPASDRRALRTFAAVIRVLPECCGLMFGSSFIPWEFGRRNPMIDLRLVARRQFGAWRCDKAEGVEGLHQPLAYLHQSHAEDLGLLSLNVGFVANKRDALAVSNRLVCPCLAVCLAQSKPRLRPGS